MYSDVRPFFDFLRASKQAPSRSNSSEWPWEKTIVGVITNSDDRVPSILESLGLKVGKRRVGQFDQQDPEFVHGEDISFVVLSYDVGHEKPQRQIFDAAENLLPGILAHSHSHSVMDINDFEKLYVGDDHQKDYIGALEAGWHALCIDRNHALEDHRPKDQDIVSIPGVLKSSEKPLKAIWDLGSLKSWKPPSDD